MSDGLICKKVAPDPKGPYQGLYGGDRASSADVEAFGQMAGAGVKLEVLYFAYNENFSRWSSRILRAASKDRAIFIKVEPWRRRGKNDQSYSLRSIVAGKHKRMPERLGKYINRMVQISHARYNKIPRIFVSFAHEMNSRTYPWGMLPPSVYKKAFNTFFEDLRKWTCHFTAVWNPDVGSPFRNYYPGDKVDWVAIDGYNWDSTLKTSDIFGGAVQILKKSGKPIMIGEFACGGKKKNKLKCIADFQKFVFNPKNQIKAYVYFNQSKYETLLRRRVNWAIETSAEKNAYQKAIRQYRHLLPASIRSLTDQEFKTRILKKPAPGFRISYKLPPGFDDEEKSSPSAAELRNRNSMSIAASRMRLKASYPTTFVAIISGWADLAEEEESSRAAMHSEYIIQWMLEREKGTPKDKLLSTGIKIYPTPSPYWRAKVAFLIASSTPTPEQIKYIYRLGFGKDPRNPRKNRPLTVPLSRAERFRLYEEILAYYSSPKDSSSRRLQKHEGRDPLLIAEILLQLVLTAPGRAQEKKYLKPAENTIRKLLKQLKTIERRRHPLRRAIKKRMQFLKDPGPLRISDEVDFYRGQIPALMAQLILHRAGKKDNLKEIFSDLEAAYKLVKQSVKHIFRNGLHYQQVKRMAAECLIRMGYIAKDLEGKWPEINRSEILREIREWERKAFRQSPRNYQSLFRAARLLLEFKGLGNESVLNWQEEYNKEIKDPAKRPAWLKQIAAYARVWKEKMEMVEIQERRAGHPTIYLAKQKRQMQNLEKIFRKIHGLDRYLALLKRGVKNPEITLKKVSGLDPDILADVLIAVFEVVAQQGLVSLNLGKRKEALDFLTKAKIVLRNARRNASPQSQAEIDLWLSKILYIEAGNKDTNRERKRTLLIAQRIIERALNSKHLHGPLLSYAYQTYGEIRVLQKKLKEALPLLAKAIEKFPQNYGAHAVLADTLNQQGKHEAAIKKYSGLLKTIKNTYPHPTLVARIRLGRAEAKMRQGENYDEDNIKILEDLILGKKPGEGVLANEAPGSFLIFRALDDLMEAYSTFEDWHEKIILIGNILLKRKYKKSKKTERFETALKSIEELPPRYEAKLYLKLAEALIWRKKFKDAREILFKQGIPARLAILIQNDSELGALYDLLRAEYSMRKKRKAYPVLQETNPALAKVIFENEDPDPDLNARLIFDQIEGLAYEKKFQKIVRLVTDYRKKIIDPQKQKSRAAAVEDLFEEKGRKLGALKFRFKLRLKMANALSWHAGRLFRKMKYSAADSKYNESLTELNDIYDKAEKLEPRYHLFKALVKAQVHVSRGDIYASEWKNQNYYKGIKNYQDAISLILNNNLRSKDARITLAWAYVGLAEIYRYAKVAKYKNFKKSKMYYKMALKVTLGLPKLSEERDRLQLKIHVGWAQLTRGDSQEVPTYNHFTKGYNIFRRMPFPPEEMEDVIYRMRNDVYMPHLKLGCEGFGDRGANEYRCSITGQIPFWRDQVTPYVQNFTDWRRDEFSHAAINTTYLGLKLKPEWLFRKYVTLDFKYLIEVPKLIGGRGRSLWLSGNPDKATYPLYYRTPNLSFTASFWHKKFTAIVSYEKDLEDKKRDTFFADLRPNLAFLKNPLLQLRIGPIFNRYNFYFVDQEGNLQFRKRFFAGLGLTHEFDLADSRSIRRRLGLEHGQVKLISNLTLPIYEYELTPKLWYMAGDRKTHRIVFTGPWQAGLGLEFNFGRAGKLKLFGEGTYQRDTYKKNAKFVYWNGRFGINWQIVF